MRKQSIIILTLLMSVLCGCSKYAGDPVSKDFNITGTYTELYVSDAFEVTVSDVASQITVTVGENIMPDVVVKKNGKSLKIYLQSNTIGYGSDMKVILPYNADLTMVNLSGSSTFHSKHPFKGQKVEIEMSGSSDFFGYVDADRLDMSLSGSADAIVIGTAGMLKMNLSGGSSIKKAIVGDRYSLVCEQCEGSMSGGSDAYIHCDGRLEVSLSGGSDLHYTGHASALGCSTSGGSEVVHDVL